MSKYMFFDFMCPSCGKKSEEFIKPDVHEIPCECGATAIRCISTPRIALSGTDPDFPGAYAKWEKKQRQKRKIEKDYFDRHGVDRTHGGDVVA